MFLSFNLETVNYVKGKRGKRVPIILTLDVKQAMDLLIKTRTDVGVAQNN